MRTINQILRSADSPLGRWGLWSNDVIGRLDSLRAVQKRRVPVMFVPSLVTSNNGRKWDCQHVSTHPETAEVSDEYASAVTGRPTSLRFNTVDVCDNGDAWYNRETEEWIYEV